MVDDRPSQKFHATSFPIEFGHCKFAVRSLDYFLQKIDREPRQLKKTAKELKLIVAYETLHVEHNRSRRNVKCIDDVVKSM